MLDKNGIEIQTGDTVKIEGAFFKRHNGLYFVDCSPGDITWLGSDYSLKKINRTGKISTTKYNLCFWPISIFVNDRIKAAEARNWNNEHATIEVVKGIDPAEIISHFQELADAADKRADWERGWGEDSPHVKKNLEHATHYRNVIDRIRRADNDGQ